MPEIVGRPAVIAHHSDWVMPPHRLPCKLYSSRWRDVAVVGTRCLAYVEEAVADTRPVRGSGGHAPEGLRAACRLTGRLREEYGEESCARP
jgi:hypothetical protein